MHVNENSTVQKFVKSSSLLTKLFCNGLISRLTSQRHQIVRERFVLIENESYYTVLVTSVVSSRVFFLRIFNSLVDEPCIEWNGGNCISRPQLRSAVHGRPPSLSPHLFPTSKHPYRPAANRRSYTIGFIVSSFETCSVIPP